MPPDLGERFHRASLNKFESEKTQAVKTAEEALVVRAEAYRQESIKKALQKAKAAQEKETRKTERAFERKLKVSKKTQSTNRCSVVFLNFVLFYICSILHDDYISNSTIRVKCISNNFIA